MFSSSRILEKFLFVRKEIEKSPDPVAKREEIMADTRAMVARDFRGMETEVGPVLDEMDAMFSSGDEDAAKAVAEKMVHLFERMYQNPDLAERFHQRLRDGEQEDRERTVAFKKGIALSPKSMLYGMSDVDDETTFRIHVATAETLVPSEVSREFLGGMRELARLAQKEGSPISKMERVVGTSWIVGEHPEVVERMGFHLAERDLTDEEKMKYFAGEKRKVRESWMSREELIEKYGEKKSP